jgi:hypothetical protein
MTWSNASFYLKSIAWLALLITFVTVSNLFLFDFARTLGVDTLKAQVGILVNVSAILFGVIGAWFALIYPTALEKIKGNNSTDLAYSGVDLQVLKSLVFILIFSSASLVLSMAIDLTLTMSVHPEIVKIITTENIKAACAIVLWFLFLMQMIAISSLLISACKLVFNLFVSKAFSDLSNLLSRKKVK